MKEHRNDAEKMQKDKKLTGFSQHFPAWDVRIIYRENTWKNRKFKEAAQMTAHNKEQLMNEKDERKTVSGKIKYYLKVIRI